MTTEEKAAKQAFIEEMLSTWTSASQAEDANNSSKSEKTVGVDDTWTIDGKHLVVEPNKTSDTHVKEMMDTWTIDKDKIIVEPNKASDILYGPDATDEWPGWPYPEQTRENSNVQQENGLT